MQFRIWITVLLFLSCTTPVFSQNTDSLLRVLKHPTNDSNTTKAYIQLAEAYLNNNPDSAAILYQNAIDHCRKTKLNKLLPNAYNGLGMAHYYTGNYRQAIQAFGNYYNAAKDIGDKIKMGFGKNNQGNVYIELGKYDSVLLLYKEALAIRKDAKDTFGIAQSFNNIGYVYKEIGDYDKAIENMLFALREFEKLKNEAAIATTENFIGQVFFKKKDDSKALQYFKKAEHLFAKLNDQRNLAITWHSIGNVLQNQMNTDSAVGYFKKALKVYENTHDVRQMALVNTAIAETYTRQKNYAASYPFFQKAIDQNNSIGNQRSLGNTFVAFAASLLGGGQLAHSKQMLDSAALLVIPSHKKTDLRDYFKTSADYFKATGNTILALQNLEQYNLYQDSILNETNTKAIADMEVKYESEKKEQEIALQKAEVQKRNAWIAGISSFLILLVLLGLSYYKGFKLKKEKQLQQEVMRQQELATKAIMEAEENERRRIATELHDGVGQLMSAARMNLSAFESEMKPTDENAKLKLEKIVNLVDESCREVRTVSHSMMPNALLKRGLAAAIRDFLDKIDAHVLKVNLYAEGLDERLESGTESMLYRIVQECVNNVIKHSGANHLDISITRENAEISLTIEDNGKGFDTSNRNAFEGIGIKNILSRVQYLKGTVDFDSAPGRGTLVAIHVPANQ